MIRFIHDGSFLGLLTAIYASYYSGHKPDQILSPREAAEDLFSENMVIETNQEHADIVYHAIISKISPNAMHHIYYAFLSEAPHCSDYIYNYLKLGWKAGSKLDMYLSDDPVRKVHMLSQKVSKEKHRMLGLLRFRELEQQILYGPMEPDHNISELIAPHFAKRLASDYWIIHDLKRNIAVLYNKKKWIISANTPSILSSSLLCSEEESSFQALWKTFYDNIAIKSRINPQLQKQFMPTRYWHHLIEKN